MMDYTNLIDKVNIPELVKALLSASTVSTAWEKLMLDAADTIESLQAEVKRLTDGNEELREQQTYIDRYGNEWHTSAKDVPNYAYEHGYADGMAEAKAQLPKQGKWIRIDKHTIQCSLCRRYLDLRGVNAGRGDANYCPNCGAKMEVLE